MQDQTLSQTRRNPRKRVALMMAAASALLFIVFVFEDLGDLRVTDLSSEIQTLILRYAIAMAVSGAVVGYLLAGFFGRRGVFGWVLMLLGGVITTTIAGILGSFFGLLPDLFADGWQTRDMIAIAAGALVLPLAITGWFPLAMIWAAIVAATHLLARR